MIAAGPGKVNEDGKVTPMDVKKGDKILFGKYSGSEITLEGDEHLIIREEDVLAVIRSNGGATTWQRSTSATTRPRARSSSPG